jgi:hypothetical protein
MPETKYTYSVASDMPGGAINAGNLLAELSISSIVTALERIDLDGDVLDIIYKDALSAGDKTTLDGDATGPAGGLLAAHDNSPSAPRQVVHLDSPHTNVDDLPYAIPKASGLGYVLNDRDVLIKTATFDNDDAVADYKVDPSNHSQNDWGEAKQLGTFKPSDPNDPDGPMVACADDQDALASGTLSLFEYQAMDVSVSGTPIPYEISGGSLYVNLHGESLGADAAEKEQHRIYAVGAPDIPEAAGGSLHLFDGYLLPWDQDWLPAQSTDAFRLDPTLSVHASKVRVWVYYPAGLGTRTHILRLKLYRKNV